MFKRLSHALGAALLVLCPLLSHAQNTPVTDAPAVKAAEPNWSPEKTATQPFYREFWDGTINSTNDIWRNGNWSLLVPARTVHMPFAYTKEQRNDQNNDPLPGIGVSVGKYRENGDWHSLYLLEFRDSWGKPSGMLGYNYNWLWRSGEWRYGWGATMGFMSRWDYFDYIPFPLILPTFQVSWGKHVSLEMTYVPGVKRGTGNVAFFWLRLQ